MKKLRVVTYSQLKQSAKVMEVDHTDLSALGLDVVAIVDGTGCGPHAPRCDVCSALRRRIRSRTLY